MKTMPVQPDVWHTDARFSPCGTYRYALCRVWAEIRHAGLAVFLCLNPSTATEEHDDPTVRRCINYARAWGYGGMVMLNLFALRSTDPKALVRHPDPVGPDNDEHIQRYADTNALMVLGWGNHGELHNRAVQLLRALGTRPLHCLRTTRAGHPAHPLYLPKHLTPTSYPPRA